MATIKVFFVAISFSLLLFLFRVWGGGDSKLIIALSSLFSISHFFDFIIITLIFGGVLTLIYWIKYRLIFKGSIDHGLPYGVAIVCGAHISLYLSQGLAIYS